MPDQGNEVSCLVARVPGALVREGAGHQVGWVVTWGVLLGRAGLRGMGRPSASKKDAESHYSHDVGGSPLQYDPSNVAHDLSMHNIYPIRAEVDACPEICTTQVTQVLCGPRCGGCATPPPLAVTRA